MQRQKIIRVEGRHGRDNPLPVEIPQSRICLMGTPAGGHAGYAQNFAPLSIHRDPQPDPEPGLERELQAKLDIPWLTGCGDDTHRGTPHDASRIPETGMIEGVEEFGAELKFEALGKLKVLE